MLFGVVAVVYEQQNLSIQSRNKIKQIKQINQVNQINHINQISIWFLVHLVVLVDLYDWSICLVDFVSCVDLVAVPDLFLR